MSKLQDLTNREFDRLTVIERAEDHIRANGRKDVMWKCECSCGNVVIARGEHLRNKHKRSCGCLRREAISQRMTKIIPKDTEFGHLTVLGESDKNKVGSNKKYFVCQCECGAIIEVEGNYLRSDRKQDCGCIKIKKKAQAAREREAARIQKLTKQCMICGSEFVSLKGNYKTCSDECSVERKRRETTIEYKNKHTDFDNRKKHDREYYLANHEELKAKQNQYYQDVGKERVKTIMVPATCSWCQTDFEMRRDAFARGGSHFCSPGCYSAWQSLSRSGDKGSGWKGGITSLYYQIRNMPEYSQWRLKVFKRDGFICQKCGKFSKGDAQAHHKKSRSQIMAENNITTVEEALLCEELWDVENGDTLCEGCHLGIKTDNPNAFHRLYGTQSFTKEEYQSWVVVKPSEVIRIVKEVG